MAHLDYVSMDFRDDRRSDRRDDRRGGDDRRDRDRERDSRRDDRDKRDEPKKDELGRDIKEEPKVEPPEKLHVGNISRNVSEEHLKEIFGNYGKVTAVEIVMDKRLNLPRGFAYVDFETREEGEVQHAHFA